MQPIRTALFTARSCSILRLRSQRTVMQKGDYVLAHKWADADPGDHWCVGVYGEPRAGRRGWHMCDDGHGKPFRGSGFSLGVPLPDGGGAWLIERMPQIDA